MASEEVEVSTSQHKVKKRGGQFCVAGGPYRTRCKNATYSHGVSMHTFPANQTTNLLWTNFVLMHRLDFSPCNLLSVRNISRLVVLWIDMVISGVVAQRKRFSGIYKVSVFGRGQH